MEDGITTVELEFQHYSGNIEQPDECFHARHPLVCIMSHYLMTFRLSFENKSRISVS